MRQSFPGSKGRRVEESKGLGSCSPTLRPFDPSTLRPLRIPDALVLILFIILALASSPLLAHEVRPAYLEIRESGPGTYDVLWKVPARGLNQRLSLNLRFADGTEVVTEPVGGFVGGAHVQRYRIRRQGGLTGTSITIDGLASTFTDVLLRLERADGTVLTQRLSPDEPSYVVEADPGLGLLVWTYLVLGVEHILLGIDHLLRVWAASDRSGLEEESGRRKLRVLIASPPKAARDSEGQPQGELLASQDTQAMTQQGGEMAPD